MVALLVLHVLVRFKAYSSKYFLLLILSTQIDRYTPQFAYQALTHTLETDVSCGGHMAKRCFECPQGHGAAWCNGECAWDDDSSKCVDKGVYM